MPAHLDDPLPTSPVDPLCFFVRGWLHLDTAPGAVAAVELYAGDAPDAPLLGRTAGLYARPDVNAALGLPASTRSGFELFAHHAAFAGTSPLAPVAAATATSADHSSAPAPFALTVRARFRDGTLSAPLAHSLAHPIAHDYRANHFGVLLDQRTVAVQGHDNIFAVGPSQSEGSPELAALLRRYLPPAPARLIDVGCGLGSYGRGLLADGFDWLGAEVNAADCAELARLGLPHRQVDGRTLPFADGAFDAALCIEVLEHIAEPRAFLAEVRRVAPRRLLVSVPNCELLAYLWQHLATPWHMLEATHVNFFTRWSLGALLREFYPEVELRFHQPFPLRTADGTPLHYNLLAIATNPAA